MKILVVDDKEKNREAAFDFFYLKNSLTVVDSYDSAVRLIYDQEFDFDIIFLDLMMPASDRELYENREHPRGALMPYGFPLMLKIAMEHGDKVKDIAIVSDVNHHNHAMSAALDLLGGFGRSKTININGIRCWFIHSQLNKDGSKNWGYALKRVIAPRELLAPD